MSRPKKRRARRWWVRIRVAFEFRGTLKPAHLRAVGQTISRFFLALLLLGFVQVRPLPTQPPLSAPTPTPVISIF